MTTDNNDTDAVKVDSAPWVGDVQTVRWWIREADPLRLENDGTQALSRLVASLEVGRWLLDRYRPLLSELATRPCEELPPGRMGSCDPCRARQALGDSDA